MWAKNTVSELFETLNQLTIESQNDSLFQSATIGSRITNQLIQNVTTKRVSRISWFRSGPRSRSCQVCVLYATLGFFFCKVAGKNPWSGVAVFWAYFKRYGCLLGKSDKQLCFFIYVRRILQCTDWHSVCSQLIANQCNNKCCSVICQMFRTLIGEKSHSKRRCVTL